MDNFRLFIEPIQIEGLSQEQQAKAESELWMILTPMTKVDLGLIQDVHLTLIVTDRMEYHIDRLHEAIDGASTHPPYSRVKNSVLSAGMTLARREESPARVFVTMANELWQEDGPKLLVSRTYLVGHELGHVLQKGRRTLEKRLRWHGQMLTNDVSAQMAAENYRDEFDADCTASSFVKLVLRTESGDLVHLGNVIGWPYVEAAQELCERLCRFAEVDVQRYRITWQGLEELPSKGVSLLGETLLVLGHVAAMFAGCCEEHYRMMNETLQTFPGFRAYIEPDWKRFLVGLKDDDSVSGEQTIVEVAKAALKRLGLELRDTEEGTHVVVDAPVFCEDCENT